MNRWIGRAAPVLDRRIAILANAEDAADLSMIVAESGGEPELALPAELVASIRRGDLGAALVTADLLATLDGDEMKGALSAQPPWSDFPIVVLADRAFAQRSPLVDALANVSLVEKPVDRIILGKAIKAALRARERQREAEAYLFQRESAEEHLRQLTATLENRVRDRMGELRATNRRLEREMEERQAAEQRLRESEDLYRYTVELSQGIVWTAAPDGTFQNMTDRFWELTGLEPGTLPRYAMHPDDRPQVLADWAKAVASGRSHHVDYRLRLHDGSYRQVRARVAPRRDEQGQVVRWYGLIEDIQEQKEAELARKEAEERYRLAARATGAAIWDLDVRAEEIRWATSEAGFFGYPGDDEITSLAWWKKRVHPDDHDDVVESLNKAVLGKDSHWSAAYRFQMASGRYADVYDQGFLLRGPDGEVVRAVGAMADVTELRRSEAETRRVQAELIHVSRLSAMGAMASALAHELNQPLTAVASYLRGSRRLLGNIEDPAIDAVAEALEAAEQGALRAGQMVRRLRELVSRGNVSTRPEQLSKLIQDANFIGFVDEGLLGATHKVELDPAAGWVNVDHIQIQQVLINLIRNALQAMEGQCLREVVIGTRAISKTCAEVSVADTGCGIPENVREALFSPFQSSKAEGMGIGLSISRTIIEAHGGKIWAEDRTGGGTIFRFTLPMVEPPSEAEA